MNEEKEEAEADASCEELLLGFLLFLFLNLEISDAFLLFSASMVIEGGGVDGGFEAGEDEDDDDDFDFDFDFGIKASFILDFNLLNPRSLRIVSVCGIASIVPSASNGKVSTSELLLRENLATRHNLIPYYASTHTHSPATYWNG